MLTYKSALAAIAAVLSAAPVTALAQQCAGNACDNVQITRLYVHTNGNTYIETSGNEQALNCTPFQGAALTLRNSDTNADEIYAMLLSTDLADETIGRIRVLDNSNGCRVAYAWRVPN